jgi:nickel/cobalt transporter (NicO) family protein
MTDLVPLMIGAALVGVLHMSAPDHWVTLCILSRTSGWNRRKLFNISLATATGHSILSATLGFGIAVAGLLFSKLISSYISYAVGFVMLTVGLFIGLRALVSKKKREVTPEEKLLKEKKTKNASRLNGIGYFAVLGAALSPDLSITPIFLASITASLLFALYLVIIFVVTSIITQLILVQVGIKGLAKTFEHIPEKYNDSIVGFIIATIGIYIIIAG